jgi:YebC/PmpR family DNA-binding regulatory protein
MTDGAENYIYLAISHDKGCWAGLKWITMAGHSKWAQIKRTKAVKDQKKGKIFAQMAREIMVAAKLGGTDPAGNFRLKTAIDRAKTAGLPNENIHRAIEKGASKGGGGDELESLSYEGYGPGGVAVFIEAMTDNRNRTAGDIRSYFNKYDGHLGSDGCVAWIFEQRGLIQVAVRQSAQDPVVDQAIEAGAVDVLWNDDTERLEITTEPLTLNAVCEALSQAGVVIDSAEVLRVPQNTVQVTTAEQAKPLMRLLEAIENQDDVQAVYANFEIDNALFAQVTAGA